MDGDNFSGFREIHQEFRWDFLAISEKKHQPWKNVFAARFCNHWIGVIDWGFNLHFIWYYIFRKFCQHKKFLAVFFFFKWFVVITGSLIIQSKGTTYLLNSTTRSKISIFLDFRLFFIFNRWIRKLCWGNWHDTILDILG